jgi:hypothetical protein
MHKDAVLKMLKDVGLSDEHMVLFKEKLKDKNFTETQCDKLLTKYGYETIFSFDEDDEDFDNGFDSYEKTHHKTYLEN